MSAYIVAQIAGIMGIITYVLLYHTEEMRAVRKVKLFVDIFWGIHYCLLGAYSGCCTSVICIARELVFLNDKKIFQKKWWPWIFIILNYICAVFTWKGFYSVFPAMASMIGTFSLWQKDIRRTRRLGICINILMFSYDVFVGSVMGMITESLTFSSTIMAMFRYRKKKHN